MAIVLDASITACWAFHDEQTDRAGAALDRLEAEGGFAPTLWWFEVRNALVSGERRGRLTPAQTLVFLEDLEEAAAIELDHGPQTGEVLRLARSYRLTAYDAAYLELALRRRLDLATLDEDLMRAARAEGVALVGD